MQESLTNAATSNLPRSIAALGDIFQIAFVPRDFDAALKFWTETMGAGPFYIMEHIQAENLKYLGEPTAFDFDAAVGYWGELQVELIRQHDDVPSIYTEWLKQGCDGLHHICISTDDMDKARQVCAQLGATVLQEASFRGGSAEVIYVDTHGGPGTIVEIWKGDEAGRAFFASIRDQARGWDGSRPLRRKGE